MTNLRRDQKSKSDKRPKPRGEAGGRPRLTNATDIVAISLIIVVRVPIVLVRVPGVLRIVTVRSRRPIIVPGAKVRYC